MNNFGISVKFPSVSWRGEELPPETHELRTQSVPDCIPTQSVGTSPHPFSFRCSASERPTRRSASKHTEDGKGGNKCGIYKISILSLVRAWFCENFRFSQICADLSGLTDNAPSPKISEKVFPRLDFVPPCM